MKMERAQALALLSMDEATREEVIRAHADELKKLSVPYWNAQAKAAGYYPPMLRLHADTVARRFLGMREDKAAAALVPRGSRYALEAEIFSAACAIGRGDDEHGERDKASWPAVRCANNFNPCYGADRTAIVRVGLRYGMLQTAVAA